MNELNKQIGQNVKTFRKIAGLKQYELAKKIGVNHITMSRIEKGSGSIKIATIQKIADVVGFPVEQIIFGDNVIILSRDMLEKLKM